MTQKHPFVPHKHTGRCAICNKARAQHQVEFIAAEDGHGSYVEIQVEAR